MEVKAYHGTGELESILKDKTLYSWYRVEAKAYTGEELSRLHALAQSEYQSLTSRMAALVRANPGKARKLFSIDVRNATDEQLADIAEDMELGEPQHYKELRRKYFVWLGNYETALQAVERKNYVLEFTIPEYKIRQGRTGSAVLVWWELSLNHLTRVFTHPGRIEETRHLLEKYGISDKEVLGFNTPPNF
ncbi:MAG: hypothetical protein Q8R04_05135 [Nanoarchaeota archaeon]|nr:hypothetical protein [Nanoarchaeota archaeon]